MASCSLIDKGQIEKNLRSSLNKANIKVAKAAIDRAAELISQVESNNADLYENSESYLAINEAIKEVFENGIQSLKSLAESGSIESTKARYIAKAINELQNLRNKYSTYDLLISDNAFLMNMIERMKGLINEANKNYKSKYGYDKIGSVYTSTILTALNVMQEQLSNISYLYRDRKNDLNQLMRFLNSNIEYYKREFIKNVLATNGNIIIGRDNKPYVRYGANSYIHLDEAVNMLLDGLKRNDVSILSMLTTSLGQTFDGGSEATFESVLRNMLAKAEIEALHKSSNLYRSLGYLLNTLNEEDWQYVIDSKRRVRTLYREHFHIYRNSIIHDLMSDGLWKYDEIMGKAKEKYVKAMKTRDVLALVMRDKYNKLVSRFANYIESAIRDYNLETNDDLVTRIKSIISDKMEIKDDEQIDVDFDNDIYRVAFHAEAIRLYEAIKEEYDKAVFKITSLIEDLQSKNEDKSLSEEDINLIMRAISETIDGLSAVKKDYNGDKNTENDFILLPDIELAQKADKSWIKYLVDENFIEGFRRNPSVFANAVMQMYSVMNSLWKVMPNNHYRRYSSGDLFYIASETLDRSQGLTGRLLTGLSYTTEAYSSGIDINSKYLSVRNIRGVNTSHVENHVKMALAAAISKIYDMSTEEIRQKIKDGLNEISSEAMEKILNSLTKEEIGRLIDNGVLQALPQVSQLNQDELNMVKEVGGLGSLLVSKAKDLAYRNASNNYPVLIAHYALTAAKFHSPLLNLNEINAIVLNFAAGERHREKIKKIISTVYFGGEKAYNESRVGKALNLFLESKRKETESIISTSKKSSDEILDLLTEFTKSEFFSDLRDTEEGKKFLEDLNSVKTKRHVKGLAFIASMNDIIRLISLTGNLKAALLNVFHGVTANFILASKYNIDESTLHYYMDIIEKGMALSLTNPNSGYAEKYLKIKRFMENYGIIGSFLDKSTLAAASEIIESLRSRGHNKLVEKAKGLAQPMWVYSRSEEYIQGSIAMAYLDNNIELYEKTSVGYRRISLLEAIDSDGYIREDILNDPKNKRALSQIFDKMATTRRILTEGHGQYGASNYTLLDGTTTGKMLLNFKKWMASYYYERFAGERYEVDTENGEVQIYKREGRYRSLDILSGSAMAGLLAMAGGGWVVGMMPLTMGIANLMRGKEIEVENLVAAMAGAVSSFATPIDKILQMFGIKSNISESIINTVASNIIGNDKAYKARNLIAVGKELGFLFLVLILKDIAYTLFQSLRDQDRDDEDNTEKRLLRIFHTISSNYISDIYNTMNTGSYAKSFILEPSVKWQISNLYELFSDKNFEYRSGVWAGYDYKTKLASGFLPRSVVSTIINPNYMFGFGVPSYYNYAALDMDIKNDERTRRIKEWIDKKGKKNVFDEFEEFMKQLFGIEPSYR